LQFHATLYSHCYLRIKIKVLFLLTHATLMWVGFSSHFPGNSTHEGNKVNRSRNMVKENNHIGWIGLIYLSGFAAIGTWSQFFYHHVFGDRLAFLPLIGCHFILASELCTHGFGNSYGLSNTLDRIFGDQYNLYKHILTFYDLRQILVMNHRSLLTSHWHVPARVLNNIRELK
jgi:hypothetical protein